MLLLVLQLATKPGSSSNSRSSNVGGKKNQADISKSFAATLRNV